MVPARRKAVKKGLQFTIMTTGKPFAPSASKSRTNRVVGQSGTGRTTFVNTLCESVVLDRKASIDPSEAHQEEGIKIKPHNVG